MMIYAISFQVYAAIRFNFMHSHKHNFSKYNNHKDYILVGL